MTVATDFIALDTLAPAANGPRATSSMAWRGTPLVEPREQFRVLNAAETRGGPTGTGHFDSDLAASGWPALRPETLEVVQLNLGKLCNMTCRHCHVDAGPDRTEENMDQATAEACLDLIIRTRPRVVDLTGGAPELNPHFEYLIEECVARGIHVMDRCNLTILLARRFTHLPQWFAERGVEVVCSLPHYRQLKTDAQRGTGAYRKSLLALTRLNEAGYGFGDPRRVLTLVTNPVGAYLSGRQSSLEREWKAALLSNHSVRFDRLLTLNNIPMSRFLEWLLETGQVTSYLDRLLAAFNPATIAGLMCRSTLSVSWDGYLYDCDFNQQLDMVMDLNGRNAHVGDFDLQAWRQHTIRTGRHCYGCTAGAGSSCGGAIS